MAANQENNYSNKTLVTGNYIKEVKNYIGNRKSK